MVNRSEMRAADDDRERVAEMLRTAHGEGRLTQDELLERVDATYEARTFRELDHVIEDLPVQRNPGSALTGKPRSAPPAVRKPIGRRIARGALNVNWWIYGGTVAVCVTVWLILAITGTAEGYWPLWVAGPWGIFMGFWELLYRVQTRER
jgi:hypothetical protein